MFFNFERKDVKPKIKKMALKKGAAKKINPFKETFTLESTLTNKERFVENGLRRNGMTSSTTPIGGRSIITPLNANPNNCPDEKFNCAACTKEMPCIK